MRFASDEPPKHAYVPFAGGRHLCIGMHLALIEGPLILASLAQRYVVRPEAGRPVVPHPAVTLRLRDGLMATVAPRQTEKPPAR